MKPISILSKKNYIEARKLYTKLAEMCIQESCDDLLNILNTIDEIDILIKLIACSLELKDIKMANYYLSEASVIFSKLKMSAENYNDHFKQILNMFALFSAELKQFDKSIEFSEKTLEIDSNNIEAIHYIACANNNLKKFDEAILYCERSIAINENVFYPYYCLGYAYEGKADYLKAEENLLTSFNMNNRMVLTIRLLIKVSYKLSKYKELVKYVAYCLSLNNEIIDVEEDDDNDKKSLFETGDIYLICNNKSKAKYFFELSAAKGYQPAVEMLNKLNN